MLAAAGGLLGGLLIIIVVACCCRRRRRGPSFRYRPSAFRSSIRRASTYLSNTSPLELSVSELLFNLTAGCTELSHEAQTTSSTLNGPLMSQQPPCHNALVLPTTLPPPPSRPLPALPHHQRARRHRGVEDHGTTTEEKARVRRIKRRQARVAAYQPSMEVLAVTPHGETLPKTRAKRSDSNKRNNTRRHKYHAAVHRTDIGATERSLQGQEDLHLPSHSAGDSSSTRNSPRILTLPDPPAESPTSVASFFSTIRTQDELDKISTFNSHSLGSRGRRASRGTRMHISEVSAV